MSAKKSCTRNRRIALDIFKVRSGRKSLVEIEPALGINHSSISVCVVPLLPAPVANIQNPRPRSE